MLRRFEIEGFKCYKKAIFKFMKGLNLIVGSSQAGKSAALQAFELVAKNRPLGARYIHKRKAGVVKVKEVFNDHTVEIGKDIIRTRSGNLKVKKTVYRLDGKKVGSAVGTGVPDKVINALNLSSVNYQEQSDDSFLITTSGGEFSKTVSKFIGMNEVEGARAKISSMISESNSKLKSAEGELKGAKGELKRYRFLPLLQVKYKRMVAMEGQLKYIEREMNDIDEFIGESGRLVRLITLSDKSKEKFEAYFKKVDELSEVEGKMDDIERFLNMTSELKGNKRQTVVVRGKYIKEIKRLGVCPFCMGIIDSKGIKRVEEGL